MGFAARKNDPAALPQCQGILNLCFGGGIEMGFSEPSGHQRQQSRGSFAQSLRVLLGRPDWHPAGLRGFCQQQGTVQNLVLYR